MKNKIVVTGGHYNSALVVAKDLRRAGYEVYWFGHKFDFRGKTLSAEYQEVIVEKLPFYELKTGRFYHQFNPFEHAKTIFGFFQSLVYLAQIRPSLIVSFGGFLAVPVVVAGWLLRIPSVTHEQTVVTGWANKAITPFVKKIFLTHQSSLSNFPKEKCVVVGLPLRPELFDKKYLQTFQPPLLYISCGKQGSHVINQAVFPLIPELVKNFTIVHQTGVGTLNRDIDKARRLKESLSNEANRYLFAPYFFSKDAATYLQSAAMVISRAGAHVTYELALLRKRVVFIPIPWVSHNEQLKNAQNAAKKTAAAILQENDLTSATLREAIRKVSQAKVKKPTPEEIEKGLSASQKMVAAINAILKS